jgi:hypothetical protein
MVKFPELLGSTSYVSTKSEVENTYCYWYAFRFYSNQIPFIFLRDVVMLMFLLSDFRRYLVNRNATSVIKYLQTFLSRTTNSGKN